ncbi:MAG: ATP-binding protein [Rhizomicrobium sp.]
MDRKKNPYAPGAGTPPPELTGRDKILDDVEVALARVIAGRPSQGMFLTGLRGVGKTVLLNEFLRIAQKEGYVVDFIEAPENRALAELLAPSLRQALLKISVLEKAKDVADRALGVLKSFTLSMKIGEVQVALSNKAVIGTADSGDLERDLPDLFLAAGEAAKANGTGIALLIDEIQYLSQTDLAALIVATHRVAQRNLPIIVIGAGLPLLPALSGDAKSYAERLFTYPIIGALEARDARRAITEPARDLNVEYTDDALEEIVRTTAGYPYFVQAWGSVVWDLAPQSPITLDDVKNASAEATRKLDESFFRVRLDRVTDSEKRYLRAMAELGSGPYKTADIAAFFKKKGASFGPVRDSLIKKGMIYSPRYGEIDFTVPLFDQFMKRAQPAVKAKTSRRD